MFDEGLAEFIVAVERNLVGVRGAAAPAVEEEEEDAFAEAPVDFDSSHSQLLMVSAKAANLLDFPGLGVSRSLNEELLSAQNLPSVRWMGEDKFSVFEYKAPSR